jgi:hypothetical protein
MPCVLAECERLYGAHGIPFFTLQCAVVDGKKQMRPPKNWQSAEQSALRFKGKNACCVRTGYSDSVCSLVVVDADGADAIVVVARAAAAAGTELVHQVHAVARLAEQGPEALPLDRFLVLAVLELFEVADRDDGLVWSAEQTQLTKLQQSVSVLL